MNWMAGTQKQDQADRQAPGPRGKAPSKTPRPDGSKGDLRDGIKPRDADPNYGPPDPDDPQRSGT
jgi:hypothetical protein